MTPLATGPSCPATGREGRTRIGRLVWILFAAGCTSGAGSDGTIVWNALRDGGCLTTRIESPPEDVDRFVIVVVDEQGREMVARVVPVQELAQGEGILLTGIPPGERGILVAGCRGAEATWWTEQHSLRIEADSKTVPLLTLRPVEGASCIGGENRHPLAPSFTGDQFLVEGRMAFGSAAAGPGGRVVVAGGAGVLEPGYGLSGRREIWEFRPASGLFVAFRDREGARVSLGVGRLGHGMAFLDERRLAVFGGASRAVLAPVGFPGPEPPIRPQEGTGTPMEVVDLESGEVRPESHPVLPLWPAVGVWRGREGVAKALVAVGGMNREDRSSSDAIVHWTPDRLDAPIQGRLVHGRFGASVTFLSGGEVLVVGGWDGRRAPGPEIERPGPDGAWIAEDWSRDWPPEGIAATAFPALAVLSDDGRRARVIVVGGNPLGAQMDWNNPDTFRSWQKAAAWILTVEAPEGVFQFGGAQVERLDLGEQEESLGYRALATLLPWPGRDEAPRWLLVGGYRSFSSLGQRAPPDCRNEDGTPKDWCFPSQILVVGWQESGLSRLGTLEDRSRLGAAVTGLPGGEVIVVGGLSGFGGTAASWVGSSGLLVTPGDRRKDDLCAAHP